MEPELCLLNQLCEQESNPHSINFLNSDQNGTCVFNTLISGEILRLVLNLKINLPAGVLKSLVSLVLGIKKFTASQASVCDTGIISLNIAAQMSFHVLLLFGVLCITFTRTTGEPCPHNKHGAVIFYR